MKRNALKPLFFLVALVLLIGLACGSSTPTQEPPPPVQQTEPPVQPAVTEAPAVTDAPAATEAPSTAQQYFTEDFNAPLSSDWVVDLTGNNKDKGSVTVDSGNLVFKLDGDDIFAYAEYTAFKYDDVKIEVSVDNRGKNTLDVVLICRASDEGWYEARIGADGLYWINAIDAIGLVKKGSNRIYNGGSTHIKTGRETNKFAFVCQGDKLSLYINDYEERTIQDTKFKFRSGDVAIGLNSFNVTPILMNFDYVTISQP